MAYEDYERNHKTNMGISFPLFHALSRVYLIFLVSFYVRRGDLEPWVPSPMPPPQGSQAEARTNHTRWVCPGGA